MPKHNTRQTTTSHESMPEQSDDKMSRLLSLNIDIGGVSFTDKALFAKHLSVMLRSGMTVRDALWVMADSAHGTLRRVTQGLVRSVDAGRSLTESLRRYPKVFSPLFISTIFAGEESGNLVENLQYIAKELEKEKELRGKIRGALMYPIVVLVATVILGFVLAFLILPKITPLFTGMSVDLPFTTRALIWVSGIIQDHGVLIFIVLVVGIVFLVWLVRQKFSQPVTHWLSLHAPVFKHLTRNANLARFCRTLGTLLRSGLTIGEALEITKDSIQNYYFKKSLISATNRITKGSKLSDNLEKFPSLYPIAVTRMIHVGEESGNMGDVLLYLADFYETEVDTATKSLTTALEPLLLIFVGLVVGFLALSIITPIYDITGNLQT